MVAKVTAFSRTARIFILFISLQHVESTAVTVDTGHPTSVNQPQINAYNCGTSCFYYLVAASATMAVLIGLLAVTLLVVSAALHRTRRQPIKNNSQDTEMIPLQQLSVPHSTTPAEVPQREVLSVQYNNTHIDQLPVDLAVHINNRRSVCSTVSTNTSEQGRDHCHSTNQGVKLSSELEAIELSRSRGMAQKEAFAQWKVHAAQESKGPANHFKTRHGTDTYSVGGFTADDSCGYRALAVCSKESEDMQDRDKTWLKTNTKVCTGRLKGADLRSQTPSKTASPAALYHTLEEYSRNLYSETSSPRPAPPICHVLELGSAHTESDEDNAGTSM